MRALTLLLTLSGITLAAARAYADDAADAVTELKAGYALKQAGNCRDALPHFLASMRLHATSKALLNAADCESRTGNLVAARLHAAQGRDLARQGQDGLGTTGDDVELLSVADDLLATIDKRMPRLTMKLGPNAPPDTVLLRDGVRVDAGAIGAPVAVNPGEHTATAKAAGHVDRTVTMTLAEGQHREIVLDVGDPVQATEVPPNPYAPPAPVAPTNDDRRSGLWATIVATPRNEVAAALVAGGVVSAVVGGGFGIAAIGKNSDSNANGHCDASGCDPTGVQLRDSALSDATVSTVLFGVGLAAIAGGAALYVTAPKPAVTAAARMELAPLMGRSAGGLAFRGAW
jgi:hypothetical protein